MRRLLRLGLVLLASSFLNACNRSPEPDSTVRFAGRKGTPQPGVTPVARATLGQPLAGQTIFVPAYGSVPIGDKAHRFGLGITLSLRNTDPKTPIVLSTIDYRDAGGTVVHRYAEMPLRIEPMAALEIFVGEKDRASGAASSFLVEWSAVHAVSAPIAETIMIGTAGTQGISFTSRGVVVAERPPVTP